MPPLLFSSHAIKLQSVFPVCPGSSLVIPLLSPRLLRHESLYYYFPDKETLYRQTLVMVFTGVQSAFKAPQGTTGIEKMECLIRNVVTYCCGNPIFTRLLLRELNEGLEERLHFLADSVFATLHENFIKILAQYGIRDTERIMESIESSLIGYLQLSRVSHSLRHYAGHPLTAAVIAERICAQIRRELQP